MPYVNHGAGLAGKIGEPQMFHLLSLSAVLRKLRASAFGQRIRRLSDKYPTTADLFEVAIVIGTAFAVCIGFAVIGAALAGCATKPVIIEKPVVVTRTVYVPIDRELTAHGEVPMPRTAKGGEALRVARTRRTALEQCHAQLDQIEAIEGTVKPSGPSADTPC